MRGGSQTLHNTCSPPACTQPCRGSWEAPDVYTRLGQAEGGGAPRLFAFPQFPSLDRLSPPQHFSSQSPFFGAIIILLVSPLLPQHILASGSVEVGNLLKPRELR